MCSVYNLSCHVKWRFMNSLESRSHRIYWSKRLVHCHLSTILWSKALCHTYTPWHWHLILSITSWTESGIKIKVCSTFSHENPQMYAHHPPRTRNASSPGRIKSPILNTGIRPWRLWAKSTIYHTLSYRSSTRCYRHFLCHHFILCSFLRPLVSSSRITASPDRPQWSIPECKEGLWEVGLDTPTLMVNVVVCGVVACDML